MTLIVYRALLILSAVVIVTVAVSMHACIVASMWGNTYASDVLLVNQGQIDVVDGDIVLVELYSYCRSSVVRRDSWSFLADQDTSLVHSQNGEFLSNAGISFMALTTTCLA